MVVLWNNMSYNVLLHHNSIFFTKRYKNWIIRRPVVPHFKKNVQYEKSALNMKPTQPVKKKEYFFKPN